MSLPKDLAEIVKRAAKHDQYKKQLNRLTASKQQTDCIEDAVKEAVANLPIAKSGSLVIYGDPQSGKTEMMICLTARLLDVGTRTIVHLMNDSVDLLSQSLERFSAAGLAPAPRNSSELAQAPLSPGHSALLFCKKNATDLTHLVAALSKAGPVVVIDDEADYATPNAKINKQQKTRINDLVTQLLGTKGKYIGVTATPARLNLNNTFDNKTETWVKFRPHNAYTGQDAFFPQITQPTYRLQQLNQLADKKSAHKALARFLVTSAFLNIHSTKKGAPEQNYSMLVHTSGKTSDHTTDRQVFAAAIDALVSTKGKTFKTLAVLVHEEAKTLYPSDADAITEYVIRNASRSAIVVLNSKRVRATGGHNATAPQTPFTVIIGGNIVSRGVTFPNLLAMYFTRDVKSRLQQDTYIQRARMFGARGKYLAHFELTIPKNLYADWHRCFVFHRLALASIDKNNSSPVWVGDSRISIASSSSIDRGTVDLNKGEMSFKMFDLADPLAINTLIAAAPTDLATLRKLRTTVGDAGLPGYLLDYLKAELQKRPGTLAIHSSQSVNYSDPTVNETIARKRGFIGTNQQERSKFPNAMHHVKIFYNSQGKARVFYKNRVGVQFVQNAGS